MVIGGNIPLTSVMLFGTQQDNMKYVCTLCDYIYDPELGDPYGDIAPGVEFIDLPEDWVCPLCGAPKEDFKPQE